MARIEKEKSAATTNVTGSDLIKLMNQQREAKDLNVIVRADVQGSLTSVVDSLKMIDTKGEINLRIISTGVGDITESDIRLAADTGTLIYGFSVNMPPSVKRLATREKTDVRIHNVIYELLDDIRLQMEEMLDPEVVETEMGKLVVRGVFKITKDLAIVGGEVTKGKIVPKSLVRIKRGKEELGEAEVINLQREKQDAKEVFEGSMCGLNLKTTKKVVVEEGDKLEFFTREMVKRHLA